MDERLPHSRTCVIIARPSDVVLGALMMGFRSIDSKSMILTKREERNLRLTPVKALALLQGFQPGEPFFRKILVDRDFRDIPLWVATFDGPGAIEVVRKIIESILHNYPDMRGYIFSTTDENQNRSIRDFWN